MSIETIDDILEELANKMGVYGAAHEDCAEPPLCCRSHFTAHYGDRLRAALTVEQRLSGAAPSIAALPACAGHPTEKGVYFWRDGSAMTAVHVHRRPTASQPGNQLNASVLPGSMFYDGCAVTEWSGQFYGPLPGTGEPKVTSNAEVKPS